MRSMTKHFTCALSVCLVALCFFAVNKGSAQLNTADILGTITDAGGAVIPGAKISVQNAATNDTKTATSNATGDFIFNLMQPGQYTVTVEATSFKKATVNLAVSAGDRA